MKTDQMNDQERKTYTWFIDETKPERKKHLCRVIIASIIVFLIVLGMIIWYWTRSDVPHITSLSLGGQLYSLWGALLLALGAISKPSKLPMR